MMIETSWLTGLHIPAALAPQPVLWFANILFLSILLFAAIKVPFRELLANSAAQHVYFGAMVCLFLCSIMK